MRLFLASATGVIGRPLVSALRGAGHEVTALARTPEKARALEAQGAEPALADAFDVEGVRWPRWRERFAAVLAGAAERARVAA